MKPVLYRISPWDKNSGTSIEYKWGGAAVTGCQAIVYDLSGILVTKFPIQTTMRTSYEISSNDSSQSTNRAALQNGSRYIMKLIVYTDTPPLSESSAHSEESDGEFFYCFDLEAPYFVNDTIASNSQFSKQVISTTFTYKCKLRTEGNESVLEGDEPSTYEVLVQRKTGEGIFDDEAFKSSGPMVGSYRDSGGYRYWEKVLTIALDDPNATTMYRISAVVHTMRGADIAMAAADFTVNYSPGAFSSLELINYPKKGYIGISANLTAVRGHLYDANGTEVPPNPDMFFEFPIDDNEDNYGLNLISGLGENLTLSVGDENNVFNIQGDTWNLFLNLVDFELDTSLFTFTNSDGLTAHLYARKKTFYMAYNGSYSDREVYYFEYIDDNLLEPVIVQSNFIQATDWDSVKYFRSNPLPTTYSEMRILFRRDPSGYYYLGAAVCPVKTS